MPSDYSNFRHPAEWEKHEATWLSWPWNPETWDESLLPQVWKNYAQFVAVVAEGEKVNIQLKDKALEELAVKYLREERASLSNIQFHYHPTNDAWCRDHGPDFLVNPASGEKLILNWEYNAWGGKYPPFDGDNLIPVKIAEATGYPKVDIDFVLEGGSLDFNGKGTVLTTENCLLHPNRNPNYTKEQIEELLKERFNVEQVVWLQDGIVGDDTDGHIDDITRFINEDTVVTVVEEDPEDVNYAPLQENLERLKAVRLPDGRSLNIVELPMPKAIHYGDIRIPASYANFYICNSAVVVPMYADMADEEALAILQDCFPDREVVGVNSLAITVGLGSFHCLSKQEPKVS